jgi:hypothetical protein
MEVEVIYILSTSSRANGASRIRTGNQGIMSKNSANSKALPDKQLTTITTDGRSAGRSDEKSEGDIPDADLAALVAAWPTLPGPIKAAIRALVGAIQ